jgi:hypothetical protein
MACGLAVFVQLAYEWVGDSFVLDNTEIRYARHLDFGGAPGSTHPNVLIGVTVNNGPTVQDVWNTTAAWGFPYSGSSVAPTPITSAKLESGAGGIGQNAAGIGVYTWINSSIYAEFSIYGAAIRGGAHPLGSTQSNVIHGISPYWRLAYEYRWDRNSMSLGTYGIQAKMHPGSLSGTPTPLAGPTDRYTDTALDFQYQFIGEDHLFTVLSTYISEKQKLEASFINLAVQNQSNTLKSFKVVGEYSYQRMVGGSVGLFNTTGSSDAGLYPSGTGMPLVPLPVGGSATNSPNSRGYVAEVNYLPWLNTKLQLQYVAYDKFNGSKQNYDGAGRNASDNNTLDLLGWVLF